MSRCGIVGYMGFMPVRKSDVVLGKPLQYSLYDGERKLLQESVEI